MTTIDKWILTKLVEMTTLVAEAFDKYQFHTALEAIQKFIWHDFCDQYLEAIKHRLYNKANQENYVAAKYTIYTVLLNSTKILSPICPHITEEIYQILFNDVLKTVHATKWPKIEEIPFDIEAKDKGNIIIETISALRNEKAKASIPLNAPTAKVTIRLPKHYLSTLKEFDNEIKQILHINETTYEEGEALKISILK